MRRAIGHVLNTAAEVHRVTTVPDGMGGYTEAWTQVGTVAARVSQPSPAQQSTAQRSEAQITHNVYLHPDTTVQRGDRLLARGVWLDVLAVTVPSIYHHAKADCRSTQHEGT